MINVSEIITDPDFAQKYKVIRDAGEWVAGRFKIVETKVLNYFGTVQPAQSEDLEQLPEVDRTSVVMNFYCASPKVFYISQEVVTEIPDDEEQIIYDTIEWNGKKYKIIKVLPWGNNGYQMAFAVEL